MGSPLYSQKPSDLAHSKESAQPEAVGAILQTCCFSAIHSLLLQQPKVDLEDHPLPADPNCLKENVFIRNLKDSPRRADAKHNQHGTRDGDTETKLSLYTLEASNFLRWETGKLSAL
jgi:hypothetical protein